MSTPHKPPRGPGTMLSYVFGFLLSLEFTIIPYNMVTQHRTVPGISLLLVIFGFAVIQMIIQVVYFLHLGRGPKPLYNAGFFAATVFAITVVTGGSVFIMHNLHGRMEPTADAAQKLAQDEGIAQVSGISTGACQQIGASHIVTISNGQVDTPHINARRCDTLTFVSNDPTPREIAFGPHDQHIPYGGVTELAVSIRHPQMITLNQVGTYPFHDHLDPAVHGFFTVTP